MYRRAPRDLSDYRAVLAGSGEVTIGAYARAQRRRRMVLAVFGLALITGAGGLYWALTAPTSPGPGDHYTVALECLSCKARQTQKVPTSTAFPIVCSACGEKACVPLWQCRDCGMELAVGALGGAARCPKCGSQRVGAADTGENR
jgi:predicted RNA-binding Zn-ribbon protein involved in translation (DUF1610 family)